MANLRENVYLLSMLPTKKQHRCNALYRTLLSLSPIIVFIYLNTAIYCNKIALKHNCQQYERLLYLRLTPVFKQYFLTLLHFQLIHAVQCYVVSSVAFLPSSAAFIFLTA